MGLNGSGNIPRIGSVVAGKAGVVTVSQPVPRMGTKATRAELKRVVPPRPGDPLTEDQINSSLTRELVKLGPDAFLRELAASLPDEDLTLIRQYVTDQYKSQYKSQSIFEWGLRKLASEISLGYASNGANAQVKWAEGSVPARDAYAFLKRKADAWDARRSIEKASVALSLPTGKNGTVLIQSKNWTYRQVGKAFGDELAKLGKKLGEWVGGSMGLSDCVTVNVGEVPNNDAKILVKRKNIVRVSFSPSPDGQLVLIPGTNGTQVSVPWPHGGELMYCETPRDVNSSYAMVGSDRVAVWHGELPRTEAITSVLFIGKMFPAEIANLTSIPPAVANYQFGLVTNTTYPNQVLFFTVGMDIYGNGVFNSSSEWLPLPPSPSGVYDFAFMSGSQNGRATMDVTVNGKPFNRTMGPDIGFPVTVNTSGYDPAPTVTEGVSSFPSDFPYLSLDSGCKVEVAAHPNNDRHLETDYSMVTTDGNQFLMQTGPKIQSKISLPVSKDGELVIPIDLPRGAETSIVIRGDGGDQYVVTIMDNPHNPNRQVVYAEYQPKDGDPIRPEVPPEIIGGTLTSDTPIRIMQTEQNGKKVFSVFQGDDGLVELPWMMSADTQHRDAIIVATGKTADVVKVGKIKDMPVGTNNLYDVNEYLRTSGAVYGANSTTPSQGSLVTANGPNTVFRTTADGRVVRAELKIPADVKFFNVNVVNVSATGKTAHTVFEFRTAEDWVTLIGLNNQAGELGFQSRLKIGINGTSTTEWSAPILLSGPLNGGKLSFNIDKNEIDNEEMLSIAQNGVVLGKVAVRGTVNAVFVSQVTDPLSPCASRIELGPVDFVHKDPQDGLPLYGWDTMEALEYSAGRTLMTPRWHKQWQLSAGIMQLFTMYVEQGIKSFDKMHHFVGFHDVFPPIYNPVFSMVVPVLFRPGPGSTGGIFLKNFRLNGANNTWTECSVGAQADSNGQLVAVVAERHLKADQNGSTIVLSQDEHYQAVSFGGDGLATDTISLPGLNLQEVFLEVVFMRIGNVLIVGIKVNGSVVPVLSKTFDTLRDDVPVRFEAVGMVPNNATGVPGNPVDGVDLGNVPAMELKDIVLSHTVDMPVVKPVRGRRPEGGNWLAGLHPFSPSWDDILANWGLGFEFNAFSDPEKKGASMGRNLALNESVIMKASARLFDPDNVTYSPAVKSAGVVTGEGTGFNLYANLPPRNGEVYVRWGGVSLDLATSCALTLMLNSTDDKGVVAASFLLAITSSEVNGILNGYKIGLAKDPAESFKIPPGGIQDIYFKSGKDAGDTRDLQLYLNKQPVWDAKSDNLPIRANGFEWFQGNVLAGLSLEPGKPGEVCNAEVRILGQADGPPDGSESLRNLAWIAGAVAGGLSFIAFCLFCRKYGEKIGDRILLGSFFDKYAQDYHDQLQAEAKKRRDEDPILQALIQIQKQTREAEAATVIQTAYRRLARKEMADRSQQVPVGSGGISRFAAETDLTIKSTQQVPAPAAKAQGPQQDFSRRSALQTARPDA